MSLTWRYRLEVALGAVATVMCAVTAAWPDWIETALGANPDHGSGWLEWLIVVVLAVAAIGCGVLAGTDRRRLGWLRAEPWVVTRRPGA